MPGGRLDQVDATRPVKQAGVISTHVLLILAPASAGLATGAMLTLLHVSRDAFFFISSCMLVYAYADLNRHGLRRFYWRRFVSVGIPYLCWTVIYYLYTYPADHYSTTSKGLWAFPHMLYTGYYHLYFLLVIMQFYVVFPLLLVLLRRTKGHHGIVAAILVAYQFVWMGLMHWNLLPPWLSGVWAQRLLPTYLIYLVGGCIVGFHLTEAHNWVVRNAWPVVTFTLLTALGAEFIYYLSESHVTTVFGSGDDPFQPSVIPFNVGAIACLYLIGVALVQPGRPRWVQSLVHSGSDNAFGVYLAQLLFINALVWLGWEKLNNSIPWPLLFVMAVPIVYLSGFFLTSLLARTPLAVPLTGRKQVSWSSRSQNSRTDDDSDTTVDRAACVATGRIRVSRGRVGNRDDDVLGTAPVGVCVGTSPD
ncbi:MAG TPA: acyltransferase [Streptosporangiaceae bacterium]